MSNGDLIAGHSHNEYSHTSNDTWVNSDHPLRATAFDALPSPETNCTHMPEFVGIPFLCDSSSLKNHIGYLYNGYSVIDSRGLCPTGWRVPSDNDWQELELFIGMPNAEVDLNVAYRGSTMQVALHLFEEVSPAWLSPNSAWHGFGTTGFDALRGGHIEGWTGRSSGHLGISFWTSSTFPVQETEIIPAPLEFGTTNRLFYRSMSNRNLNQGIFRSAIPKSSGAYVRCIKN